MRVPVIRWQAVCEEAAPRRHPHPHPLLPQLVAVDPVVLPLPLRVPSGTRSTAGRSRRPSSPSRPPLHWQALARPQPLVLLVRRGEAGWQDAAGAGEAGAAAGLAVAAAYPTHGLWRVQCSLQRDWG